MLSHGTLLHLHNYVNELLSKGSQVDLHDKKRGRIAKIQLKKPLTINEIVICFAIIEIDHLNHGLNLVSKKLNKKRRLSFTVRDVELFLDLLDDEEMIPLRYTQTGVVYEAKIRCPVLGRFHLKEFLLIFSTYYSDPTIIRTITLIPSWKKKVANG